MPRTLTNFSNFHHHNPHHLNHQPIHDQHHVFQQQLNVFHQQFKVMQQEQQNNNLYRQLPLGNTNSLYGPQHGLLSSHLSPPNIMTHKPTFAASSSSASSSSNSSSPIMMGYDIQSHESISSRLESNNVDSGESRGSSVHRTNHIEDYQVTKLQHISTLGSPIRQQSNTNHIATLYDPRNPNEHLQHQKTPMNIANSNPSHSIVSEAMDSSNSTIRTCQSSKRPEAPQITRNIISKRANRGQKSKRIRTIFTPEQLKRLEQEFSHQMYLVGQDRGFLAKSLNLSESQVKVWFQNRRIKLRKVSPSSESSTMSLTNDSTGYEPKYSPSS